MAAKKADKRKPADQLLLEFLKEKNIVLIVDEASLVNNTVKDLVWVVDKRPRVRVYYQDQIEKQKNGDATPDKKDIKLEN